MRLSQIYCNQPDRLGPIRFNAGFNVILGEIRLPENPDEDTHCLGKTTLARLIDFCLLKKRYKDFFLFKHEQLFADFVFFLEIEALSGGYLTIRRSVSENTRIAFKHHAEPLRNFVQLPDSDWDHVKAPFERARQILDGVLDLRAIKPWDYRMPVSYALRTQKDFNDIFQLDKFRGAHAAWKPYVAHLLGFDEGLVRDSFDLTKQIETLKQGINSLRAELLGVNTNLDTIEGLLTLRSEEAESLASRINAFDFRLADSAVNKEIVEDLDRQISAANQERYYLSVNRAKIVRSLEEHAIVFEPETASRLFEEAGQVFPGQIRKAFEDLIRFNRAITNERKGYLLAEMKTVDADMLALEGRLEALNRERTEALAFLRDADSIQKYRDLNKRLVTLRAEIERLTAQREAFLRLREKERERVQLEEQRVQTQQRMEDNIEGEARSPESRYQAIRRYVNEFTREVVDRGALVSTRLNKEGNIEFSAEYLGADGKPSSEDQGKSYRQLLCAAFDLAVARAMLKEPYIRFLYHDGLLEGLDNRKKLNLISTIRRFATMGIQQIVTVIDSDLPMDESGERFAFRDDEVVLVLHDKDDSGRLFRLPRW
ncbi:MAG: DUF2326 domain-containing protein [Candidatus Peribacteraceae bacterium]|jgi:uncharacterized protein YydD (DUF2326 family)|nr:DUF2326 domain-containing protein [Candidatus Peribacteraceae bacterium]